MQTHTQQQKQHLKTGIYIAIVELMMVYVKSCWYMQMFNALLVCVFVCKFGDV